jgi:putative flavoprotein involved in K+ transport
MADYLRTYAAQLALPVRTGVDVHRLSGGDAAFVADTSQGAVRACQVVLATGPVHPAARPGRSGRPGTAGAPVALQRLPVTCRRPAG